jgi:hypothetical protein
MPDPEAVHHPDQVRWNGLPLLSVWEGVSVRLRLLAGAAGLGYVVAAAVENMEVLGAPLLGASDASIRAAHADVALGIVTTAAGALSLALYVVWAVALRRRWAVVALVGASLAFAGVVANAMVLAGGDPWLYELMLYLRYAAGPFMAGFLVIAASGTPLRALAFVVAVPLALTPLAMTGELQIPAAIAFSAHALCIWLASLLLLFGGLGRAEFARRAAFLMLVVAAGAVGLALLIVPDATGSFFAWTLQPSPLAAFAGGVYVGSAVVYAVGLRAVSTRSLLVAAVVLSVSVFAVTLIHLEVFDLSRLQAWAWLFLFAGFATVTGVLALRRQPTAPSVPLSPAVRAVFAAAAVGLGAAGLALWADPAAFSLPPLGGRFAGSWTVMLAVLAAWPAVLNRRDEAALPALALIALPAGALVAAARTGAGDPLYLASLGAVLVAGVVAQRGTGWRGSYSPSGPNPGTSMLASTPQP